MSVSAPFQRAGFDAGDWSFGMTPKARNVLREGDSVSVSFPLQCPVVEGAQVHVGLSWGFPGDSL